MPDESEPSVLIRFRDLKEAILVSLDALDAHQRQRAEDECSPDPVKIPDDVWRAWKLAVVRYAPAGPDYGAYENVLHTVVCEQFGDVPIEDLRCALGDLKRDGLVDCSSDGKVPVWTVTNKGRIELGRKPLPDDTPQSNPYENPSPYRERNAEVMREVRAAAQVGATEHPAETPNTGEATDDTGDDDGATCADSSTDEDESAIPQRGRTAHQQYLQAAEALGRKLPTDDEAYDQLHSAYESSGEAHELPGRDTWKRNLRLYRQQTKTQKYASRTGRADDAGSVVDEAEL